MSKNIYFFIGTEAELIKVFPVIVECQNNGAICNIIASGQNDITKSRIMEFTKLNGKFLELSKEESITKSALGLMKWFVKTKKLAAKAIENEFGQQELQGAYMVIHGDTVSTMMGAMVGKKLGMIVCHVEAGLRSHNLFNPFPEEIDRLVSSRMSEIHFAPGDEPAKNLKNAKGQVVNTKQNTLIDSLRFSENIPVDINIAEILSDDYFVFVMHRQENLANKKFVCDVAAEIINVSKQYKCVLILHEITKNAFKKFGIMDMLDKEDNIILQPRVDYFDFMKLLKNARFVITDGGSNQEELFYMNKPCLIMRKTTERREGLGKNARLFNGDASDIRKFVSEYKNNKREVSGILNERPSQLIANILIGGII